jgi:RNA polymerase sigma-70 factor (ECF subfamily)
VLLKLVEEEETDIVCKELNITATNYWVIIHRAKLQLRACLEKNWFKA